MKNVMIIAGEASGDLHAAKLVQGVLEKSNNVHFYGIGGENMKKAGVEVLLDSAQLAVVGLIEVIKHRKVIFDALNKMREMIKQSPPDLLILVDYPEFNLKLAETAKRYGVKVLFYISPQVWAWRQGRVKKIRKRVDMMAVVFPFEEEFYKKHNVPVRYVGHPLTNEVHSSASREELIKEFGLDDSQYIIGLFPGSRLSELTRLFPVIIETANLLKNRHPDIQFLLPAASTLPTETIRSYLDSHKLSPQIKLIEYRQYDVMQACDIIITVSGTVTLEIALIGTPMVIINRLSSLTYAIVSRMIKISYIGLCNIVANKKIVPELIQDKANAVNISKQVIDILENQEIQKTMRMELAKIHDLLGNTQRSCTISELTLELLEL